MNKRGSCYPSAVVMKNFISWITVAISIIISFDYAIAANVSLKITAPANGAIVNGTVTIATAESSNVSWINVFVDNVWVASNSPTALRPYSVSWDSTTVQDGKHSVSVTGYSSRNSVIAKTAITVIVLNQQTIATPSPTPTITPAPAPTPTPPSATAYADPSTHTDPNAAAGQRHADSRCYRDLLPVVRRRSRRHGRA